MVKLLCFSSVEDGLGGEVGAYAAAHTVSVGCGFGYTLTSNIGECSAIIRNEFVVLFDNSIYVLIGSIRNLFVRLYAAQIIAFWPSVNGLIKDIHIIFLHEQ